MISCNRLLIVVVILTCAPCVASGDTVVRSIPQTHGFRSDSQFHFSISPDDRWLVFFRRVTEKETGTRHNIYGNLQLLQLSTNKLHSIVLSKDAAPKRINVGDASWREDSSECVLPSPSLDNWVPQPGVLIDLSDEENILVKSAQIQHGPERRVDVSGIDYEMPTHFTCSDCTPFLNDVALMRKHIDPANLHFGDLAINRNDTASQIVSPDGTKIYYQVGRKTSEVSLMELDVASGQGRELTMHKGDCITIDRMRPSPDGRKLAYQVTTGCDFVSTPKVFVLDVATRDREHVAGASGGTMHWTSTSDRLYFYRDDYLHVAEFKKPQDQPATKPAAAPNSLAAPAPAVPSSSERP